MQQITHPYIFTLHGQLLGQYRLLTMLHKRLDLIRNDFASKSEFERNEIEITEFETKGRMLALTRIVKERSKYFKDWLSSEFIPKLKDLEANFERDLKKANELALKKPEIKNMLEAVNWDYMEKNIEGKFELHKRIKGYL